MKIIRKQSFRIIAVLFFLLCIPSMTWAWGIIQGVVRNDNDNPISGAVVETDLAAITTDFAGYYMLALPSGTTDITASASGYEPQTQSILVETGTKDLDFSLSPSPPPVIGNVTPSLGEVGNELDVTISGSGFDEYTKVSMSLDTGGREKIIGSFATTSYAKAVAVKENTAFVVTMGGSVEVIDISNPAYPSYIKTVATTGTAKDIAIEGNTAYVASGGDLEAFDISNPTDPILIAPVVTPGSSQGVTIVENIAYLAGSEYVGSYPDGEGFAQLVLVNVDPNSTDYLSVISVYSEYCEYAAAYDYDNPVVDAGIAYVTGGCNLGVTSDANLHIINVSDPANIEKIGTVRTRDSAVAIAVNGDFGYLADNKGGLHVIDLNPDSGNYLQIINHVNTTSAFVDVVNLGNTLYIASAAEGLKILDIDPDSESYLNFVGAVDTPGTAAGVNVIGSTAYMADGSSGLQIIDVSTSSPQNIIGRIETGSQDATSVALNGNTAYLASGNLIGIDIDPDSDSFLEIIGSVETPAQAVAISGSNAYVAAGGEGLQIIDLDKLVSDPQNAVIGTVSTSNALDVVVIGTTAYVADGGAGLKVIDITNSTVIGSVYTGSDAQSVFVSGTIAYVANGYNGGLVLVDLTTLSIIDTVYIPDNVTDVIVIGSIAYVAHTYLVYSSFLRMIDVDPTPGNENYLQTIGTMNIPAYKLTVSGNTLYVAGLSSAVQAIDISDPSRPVLISTMDVPGYTSDIVVNGGIAYITDKYPGFCCPTYSGGLTLIPVPVRVEPISIINETEIRATLPSPIMEGNYTIRVFNNVEHSELFGAVTFTDNTDLLHARAIIVAGGGPNATGDIWEETKNYAREAYNSLIYQGYKPENIYYLTDEGTAEGRDAGASLQNLQYAVTEWANDDPATKSLVIYLVDHGEEEQYQIRGNANPALAQYVTASQLDSWLDTLQSGSAIKVLVVYDACFSGSFVDTIRDLEDTRVVITSVDRDEVAYFLDLKQSFSGVFWGTLSGKIGTQGNLYNAWSLASGNMANYQAAQLDANGNGVTNEPEDVDALEKNIFEIGRQWFNAGFSRPIINVVTADKTLAGGTSTGLSAWGIYDLDKDAIARVWAEIIAPDFVPSANVTITSLPTVALEDPDKNGTYTAVFPDDAVVSYPGFNVKGTYIINYYAEDSSGVYSEPKTSLVTQTVGTTVSIPDQYEDDDTANNAGVIVLNDPSPQDHSFHDANDEDWVVFYGLAGTVYSVRAMNPTIITDPVIEIYNSNNLNTPLISSNTAGIGQEELLKDWTCPADGLYYVRLTNNSGYYGANVRYKLKVYNPIAFSLPGYVKGKITSGGQGVARAVIRAGGGTAITLSDGSFILCLKPGSYSVSVSCDGYQSTSFSVNVGTGQNVSLSRDMNSVPRILNYPATRIKANEEYSYIPLVSDVDGDPLTYSITGKPAWALFSTVNGRLWGVPSNADKGSYGPINIKVKDNAGASDSVTFNIKVEQGSTGLFPGILMLLNQEQ